MTLSSPEDESEVHVFRRLEPRSVTSGSLVFFHLTQ